MKREQVLAKLNAKVKRKVNGKLDEALQYVGALNVAIRGRIFDEAAKITARNVSGLTYIKRDNYFSNSSGSCGFNPETGEGHSYSWYKLTKRIKGKLVLNDYRYSQQTALHIRKMHDVLKDLGLKYMTIDAPRGLQDLGAALEYALNRRAERYVSLKYGRDLVTEAYLKGLETPKGPEFTKLAMLGQRATKKGMLLAIARAEASRKARLERQKAERAIKKAMSLIQVESDFYGTLHDETDGLHLDKFQAWQWNEAGTFEGGVSDYDKRNAVRQGLTKIYIHGKEKRHLRVVNGPELVD